MANLTINIDKLCELLQAESGTYAQLSAKATNAELLTGRKYLMTDFQTIYDQVGTAITKSGPIEVLILTASSPTTFSPIVASASNPNDIIKYDITINQTFINNAPCKGRITERSCANCNTAGYDFRAVLNWDGTNEFLTFNGLSLINDINGYLSETPFTGQEFPNVIFKDICARNKNNYFLNAVFENLVGENLGCNFENGIYLGEVFANKSLFVNSNVDCDIVNLNNLRIANTTFNCNKFIHCIGISSFNSGFENCTIDGDVLTNNTFETLVVGKTITEVAHPFLFSDTPCTIYQKSNGEVWYRYYDNSNNLIQTQIS